MNVEINLIFLFKPFFLHDGKVMTKIYLSWEQKELLRVLNRLSYFGRLESNFKTENRAEKFSIINLQPHILIRS